jgi:hypothetical protein
LIGELEINRVTWNEDRLFAQKMVSTTVHFAVVEEYLARLATKLFTPDENLIKPVKQSLPSAVEHAFLLNNEGKKVSSEHELIPLPTTPFEA